MAPSFRVGKQMTALSGGVVVISVGDNKHQAGGHSHITQHAAPGIAEHLSDDRSTLHCGVLWAELADALHT